jgi:hypothetical protein
MTDAADVPEEVEELISLGDSRTFSVSLQPIYGEREITAEEVERRLFAAFDGEVEVDVEEVIA